MHSAEIVAALINLAKKMRTARRRHEALGLTKEEAAFYDARAGTADDWKADETLADIAREVVAAVKKDLSVDWTTHDTREAAVRRSVKRLLQKKRYEPVVKAAATSTTGSAMGGEERRPLDLATDLILQTGPIDLPLLARNRRLRVLRGYGPNLLT